MVFLPDEPANIFRNALGQWEDWRDGAAVIPHQWQPPIVHACVIKEDFISRDGHAIKYKQGMQGHFLRDSTNDKGMRMAKIFIQGITEHGPHDGQANAWVPYDMIKIGPRWKANIDDWDIDISPFKGVVRWSSGIQKPGDDRLAATVKQLIQALLDTPTDIIVTGGAFASMVKKYGAGGMAEVVLRGIRDAGLYQALLKEDFTHQDLLDAATCTSDSERWSEESGIYIRFHESAPDVARWSPNTSYVYVGKTRTPFRQRFRVHPTSTTMYGDLVRGSASIRSFAACIIDKDVPPSMFYVAEQVFVCLMGAYRSFLVREDSELNTSMSAGSKSTILSWAAARYFHRVSNTVFDATGWRAATTRPMFGINAGANFKSPMEEIGYMNEKLLFIRTDFLVRDHDKKKSVPMAEFRRSSPVKMSPGVFLHTILCTLGQKGERVQVGFNVYRPKEAAVGDYPPNNADVYLIFEIRLDGEAIKNSWARLSDVAPFKNWHQANSFAVRYEWEQPAGSGKWRHGYIQRGTDFTMIDAGVPGSFTKFSKALGILHWLLGTKPTINIPWVHRPVGAIKFLTANYDFMAQSIRFSADKPDINIIPTTRNSPANIGRQMNAKGVGRVTIIRRDRICDICNVVPPKFAPRCKGREETVCEACRSFSLPYSPFVPNFPGREARSSRGESRLTADQRVAHRLVMSALVQQPATGVIYKTHSKSGMLIGDDNGAEGESEDEDEEEYEFLEDDDEAEVDSDDEILEYGDDAEE